MEKQAYKKKLMQLSCNIRDLGKTSKIGLLDEHYVPNLGTFPIRSDESETPKPRFFPHHYSRGRFLAVHKY